MTEQRQSNPLWVDRALRTHWAAIESRVGSRLMPVPSSVTRRRSPVPHAKRARGFYEWGTGSFGTVLPTRDPNVVVKVTSDRSEVEFVLRAERLGHWPDGLVRYYQLLDLGKDRTRHVYAMWREAAYAVGLVIYDAEFAMRRLKLSHATFTRGVDLLNEFYKTARTVYQSKQPKVSARASLETLPDLAKQLSRVPGFREIGKTLSFYLDNGIVLADLHANNVGLVDRRNKPTMVLTDPGHALFLEKRSSQKAANP